MIELTNLTDFNNALKTNDLVVVDFYAKWCGPCKGIKPYFEELSKLDKFKKVYFCAVDIDVGADIAEACDIQSLPTFLFYKKCKCVDELIGANKEELKSKLEKLIA